MGAKAPNPVPDGPKTPASPAPPPRRDALPSHPWPTPRDPRGQLHHPITEDWLRSNGFAIEDGRNDPRSPIRSLAVAADRLGGRGFLGSSDDLTIDIAPVTGTDPQTGEGADGWYVWIGQREPYRHIHVRHMHTTGEVARLYEALTGRLWPGSL